MGTEPACSTSLLPTHLRHQSPWSLPARDETCLGVLLLALLGWWPRGYPSRVQIGAPIPLGILHALLPAHPRRYVPVCFLADQCIHRFDVVSLSWPSMRWLVLSLLRFEHLPFDSQQ